MPWVNKHNLPNTLATAIKRVNSKYDHNDDPNHFSATEILKPIRQAVLSRRFRGKIVTDVADAIYRADGNSLHEMLAEVPIEPPVLFKEQRFKMKIDSFLLSGQIDLYEEGGIVSDWKRTSVNAATKSEKPEWEGQTNIYGLLLREAGRPTSELHIYAILRDWMKSRTRREATYPVIGFVDRQFPIWDDHQTWHFAASAMDSVRAVEDRHVKNLPLCTPIERWTRGENWGIIKKGRKRATKKCYSEEEAMDWVRDNSNGTNYDIEHRPGIDIRCLDWCDVCEYCDYWQSNVKTSG